MQRAVGDVCDNSAHWWSKILITLKILNTINISISPVIIK